VTDFQPGPALAPETSSPRSDGPLAQIKNGFSAASEDAGLDDSHSHDLRHTFARLQAEEHDRGLYSCDARGDGRGGGDGRRLRPHGAELRKDYGRRGMRPGAKLNRVG
jgi:hypothetical protein